jgi:hypothetical protein
MYGSTPDRLGDVIEDHQRLRARIEVVPSRASGLLARRLWAGLAQLLGQSGKLAKERVCGVEPEDASGVVLAVGVRVLDGELRLADAA